MPPQGTIAFCSGRLASSVEELENWCCGGDTPYRQIATAHSHPCCSSDQAGATIASKTFRSPSRRTMKPYRGDSGFVRWLSFLGRASWCRLQAIAIAVLLLLPIGTSSALAMPNSASAASTAHVYLLRGVFNIFSLGLDDIAAKLRAQGIPVTVANFASWSSLADEAAAKYRSRQDQDHHSGRAFLGRDRAARHGRQAGSVWRPC